VNEKGQNNGALYVFLNCLVDFLAICGIIELRDALEGSVNKSDFQVYEWLTYRRPFFLP
jgi:hypothetical protein